MNPIMNAAAANQAKAIPTPAAQSQSMMVGGGLINRQQAQQQPLVQPINTSSQASQAVQRSNAPVINHDDESHSLYYMHGFKTN